MLPNVPAFAIAYYGILKAGGVVVPMNVMLKAREIGFYLEDSGATVLVSCAELGVEAEKAGVADVVTVGGHRSARQRMARRADSDTAVLLYTSGTTGKPKGAQLTHANLLWNAQVAADLFALTADDVVLGTLPLFHSFGQTCGLNATMRAGGRLALLQRFEPELALDLIEGERATVFLGVPTMYVALLHAETAARRDLASLRLCVSGGASLPVEVLRGFEATFQARVLEGYGLSETSPVATFNHLDRPSRPGSIGTAIWGTELRIADDDGGALPPGAVGEILIRGHNVMAGYWRRPEETAAAIDADGWLRTGDMARMDDDGYVFVVDRKKELIIRGGYNVYPREVEEVLYEHPAVLEAAVLGVPHPQLGEEVAAAVVVSPGADLDPDELRAWMKDRMAAYKYPRHVALLDALPKGPTGKILKREIDRSLLTGVPTR
jgi:long-chain acyl-CoA synthetase